MIIIDFDDTLFNTNAFKQARLEAVKKAGVSADVFWQTYKKARNDQNGIAIYTDKRHAAVLAEAGCDEKKVLAALQGVSARIREFLFPDAIEFLHRLRRLGQTMILLSLGDSGFQEGKVSRSGVRDYFDQVVMVDSVKEPALAELCGGMGEEEAVWFVNDKVPETQALARKFSRLKPVLKASGAIPREEYEASGLVYFETLKEIQTYLEKSI